MQSRLTISGRLVLSGRSRLWKQLEQSPLFLYKLRRDMSKLTGSWGSAQRLGLVVLWLARAALTKGRSRLFRNRSDGREDQAPAPASFPPNRRQICASNPETSRTTYEYGRCPDR